MNLKPFSKSSSKLHRKKQKELQQLLQQKKANAPTSSVKRKGLRFKRRIDSNAATDNPIAEGKAEENKLVINLSNIPMTEAQGRLLTLGPKFCPTPRFINTHQLSEDVREGCQRVRLQEWHHTSDTDDSTDEEEASAPKFYTPTGFMPPVVRDKTSYIYIYNTYHIWSIDWLEEVLRGLRNFLNMDRSEHHSIDDLKERGMEKGSGRHSTLRSRERSVFNQTNTGTVSRTTMESMLRDGAERVWVFPSAKMSS